MTMRLPFRGAMALVLAIGLVSCNDDPTGNDNGDPLVATWQATSFASDDMDVIAEGMTLRMTLTASGTYTFTVTNDLVGICEGEGGEDCTSTGSYAATAGTVTIDDDETDNVTFTSTISGNVMTWTGTIDGTAITIVWTRVG